MNALARYWNLWCISLSNDRLRYQRKVLPSAQSFCENQQLGKQANSVNTLSDTGHHRSLQKVLLSQFHHCGDPVEQRRSLERLRQRAVAGLCLRCYVSEPILRACQKIDSLFSGNKSFSYQDLLPFVLNDDGKNLVVIDDTDQQQVLDESSDLKPSAFKIFALEVLRTYKDDHRSMSLENWTFLRTKQHPELKNFLAEFGFQPFSDWTLINRIRLNQLERLSAGDRYLVEAFHKVYRRDRRQTHQTGRCQDPTAKQLTEMNELLKAQGTAFDSTRDLFKALKQVAKQLRQFDIWQAREPLEVKDMETGTYALRVDLPADSLDESEIEEQDFVAFLRQQLAIALDTAIEQAIQSRSAKLKKSKKYAPFASAYAAGLQRYYTEGISLKEIGAQLGMSSWDQTRRILNPGELLSQVRLLTAQQLLAPILTAAQAKGLAATPADPSYLRTLMEQIEDFIDTKLFSEAASEIKAGKNRSLDSKYAQHLTKYLNRSFK
ncbi:MAG: hypothetical protein WBB01_26540 [Phormidesmis sp.]